MELLQNIDPSHLPFIAVGCALLCVSVLVIGFLLQAVSSLFDVVAGLIQVALEIAQGGPIAWCGCSLLIIGLDRLRWHRLSILERARKLRHSADAILSVVWLSTLTIASEFYFTLLNKFMYNQPSKLAGDWSWPARLSRYQTPIFIVLKLTSEASGLRNKRWDLFFITLSVVVVPLPYLMYLLGVHLGLEDDISRNLVNTFVAVAIGGPHMMSTFLRTGLDERFKERYPTLVRSSNHHSSAGDFTRFS